MKIRTILLSGLLIPSILFPLVVSAQRDSKRLSADKIKSMGLIIEKKDEKQRTQIISIAAKKLNVDKQAFNVNMGVLKKLTPDLTVTDVHDAKLKPGFYVIVVQNIGPADAGPCKLRFMYGMTWDALSSIDMDVPAIAAGKSTEISFKPPDKPAHWWMFGVDVDNKLGEANFSNNLYVIEFKDTQ